MLPGGRLAVIELVLGELSDPGLGALMDMNMLAASPGQERSPMNTTRSSQRPACGARPFLLLAPRKA